MRELIIILLAAALFAAQPATMVAGFLAGVVIGLLIVYRYGWNARGDYDEAQAIEGVKKKNQSARM